VQDAYLPIGDIEQTVYVRKFQGVRDGHFRDCTDVEIRKGDGTGRTVRLTDDEVQQLIALLANAIKNNIPVR
jgi:hypothetical protein